MTFDSTQGIPPVSGNCIISYLKEYVFDMKKSIAIKLNGQYANLADGTCPSHHSPNDVISLSNDNSCLWLGKLTIFDQQDSLVEAY